MLSIALVLIAKNVVTRPHAMLRLQALPRAVACSGMVLQSPIAQDTPRTESLLEPPGADNLLTHLVAQDPLSHGRIWRRLLQINATWRL